MIFGIIYSPVSFFIVFLTILIVGIWEFYQLFENPSHKSTKAFGIILGIIIYSMFFLDAMNGLQPKVFTLLIPLFFLMFFFNLYADTNRKKYAPFINILGALYVAIPMGLLSYLVFDNYAFKPYQVLGLIWLIWTNDSFAYFTGSLFGKKKLFERISPGKSWEGFFGGLVFTLAMGYGIGIYFEDTTKWVLFGFCISVFGTIGDLVESQMKRLAGAKDSGTILPGHGGVLDRFDALLFAIPFVFVVEVFF